jgi:hypothetical protein
MADGAADELFAALYHEVDLRVGAGPGPAGAGHTQQAFSTYAFIAAAWAPLEPAARAALEPLCHRVRADAAAHAAEVRADPASPGLEEAHWHLLGELSLLAAAFVTSDPATRRVPDPRDRHAGAYRGVCGALAALAAVGGEAQQTWRLLREGRGRPPPRRPRRPPADDREYYL